MKRLLLPVCLLFVSCTIPPTASEVPSTPQAVRDEALAAQLLSIHTDLVAILGVLQKPVPPAQPISFPMPPPALLPATKPAKLSPSKAGAEKPEQIIRDAQQAARVYPTRQGYFGGSTVYRYVWQPGKVYVIYLTPTVATDIILPPGEQLAGKFALNPQEYVAGNLTVGSEMTRQDRITVRPLIEAGEAEAVLVTEAGHAFNLHFLVGKVAMSAVTFEIPVSAQVLMEEEPRIPR